MGVYIDNLVAQGYGGYIGWNDDAAAKADFEAGHGGSKWTGGGGGAGGDDYTSGLIGDITGQISQGLEFDKDAARRAAEQEWDAYFDEILQDYQIENTLGRERSIADLASSQGLAGARRTEFLGDIDRESPIRQEQIGGQFADRGLFFSGGRQQTQQRQLDKETRSKATFEREFDYNRQQADLKQERYLTDLDREKRQRERDLARDREQAITGQVQTLREEKFLGY